MGPLNNGKSTLLIALECVNDKQPIKICLYFNFFLKNSNLVRICSNFLGNIIYIANLMFVHGKHLKRT